MVYVQKFDYRIDVAQHVPKIRIDVVGCAVDVVRTIGHRRGTCAITLGIAGTGVVSIDVRGARGCLGFRVCRWVARWIQPTLVAIFNHDVPASSIEQACPPSKVVELRARVKLQPIEFEVGQRRNRLFHDLGDNRCFGIPQPFLADAIVHVPTNAHPQRVAMLYHSAHVREFRGIDQRIAIFIMEGPFK